MRQIQIHAQRRLRTISIQMAESFRDGSWLVAQPVAMGAHNMSEEPPDMLNLQTEQAQQLMDELWNCGIRPTEGAGSAGAMAAVQAHLKDLQTLVFHKEN